MASDLTGGIDPQREHMLPACPADPEMRDSVSFWVFDDRGEIGLPRIGIEAVGANWAQHGVQANVAFPDGRVYRLRSDAPSLSPIGPEGLPTVLGAGPLTFRCVAPFKSWQMTFDGDMTRTSTAQLVSGEIDGPTTRVQFEVEAEMAVPPWEQGAMSAKARSLLAGSVEGALMGGDRYEQLFRASGSVTIDGARQEFSGTGLRIRRTGVRHLAEFRGHAWQTALFPGGRAFGYIAYPPRDDGEATFNEGYLFDGDGELVPATVVEAPWFTSVEPLGQDVSLVLQTERGLTTITGETVIATFDIHHQDKTFSIDALRDEHSNFPALQQAGVRYTWDGEIAYGMIERSNPIGKISFPSPTP
jgi:hypothetical protein